MSQFTFCYLSLENMLRTIFLDVWILLFHVRQSRKKFGILEKHKDYVVRAKAYHKKEEALRVRFLLLLSLF